MATDWAERPKIKVKCPGCGIHRVVTVSALRCSRRRTGDPNYIPRCKSCACSAGRTKISVKVKQSYSYDALHANIGVAPSPTTAAPGTPEKLAVMAARYAAGQALFHPDDAIRLVGKCTARTAGVRDDACSEDEDDE